METPLTPEQIQRRNTADALAARAERGELTLDDVTKLNPNDSSIEVIQGLKNKLRAQRALGEAARPAIVTL